MIGGPIACSSFFTVIGGAFAVVALPQLWAYRWHRVQGIGFWVSGIGFAYASSVSCLILCLSAWGLRFGV